MHDTSQDEYAPHCASTQSKGHAAALHGPASDRLGQEKPPCLGSLRMARVRFWEPLPQVLEQGPKAPHLPTSQWMGQVAVPHF